MANVYLIMDKESLPKGNNLEYYITLIVNEINSRLNSNAINYIENESESSADTVRIKFGYQNSESNEIKIISENENPDSNRMSSIILKNLSEIYKGNPSVKIYSESTARNNENILVNIIFGIPKDTSLNWLTQNIENILEEIIMSLDEYFGLPYIPETETVTCMSIKDESIRKRPSLNSEVIGSVQGGKSIKILGQWENWYVVGENKNLGFIQTKFISC